MREIKFRAWNKRINRMRYEVGVYDGLLVYYMDLDEEDLRLQGDIEIFRLPNEQFELMQYTGLKDKKGKEIYEGDIITVTLSMPTDDQPNPIDWIAKYNHASFWMYDWRSEKHSAWALGSQMEVIGNIFQNSELLQT